MSAQFETFGKYVLLEKLATGGMAEVFLARGTGAGGIGKFFAIKRILPQYADSPEFIDMFKAEAKIAINLAHSNIVSIHEFGVEKGQFFLVMDYVEGRNLRQILNKMKKSNLQFSLEQIVYVIKEVAAGLDHAHRCIDGSTGKPLNITHRDMSPQNIMVSFEGEVKIVDFGIAKAESQIETTRAGTLKGKFGYMSPEQAEGLPVDLRTDIFSLGIVLWELLAHDRLFMANNEINTLRKIRDCQIPSLRKINPNIHAELERITQKALTRDRNLRHQTGAAMHRELNRFLNRQFPDFSPQDFSVFTKSVFADEILSLRKRLVEYSNLNVVGPEPIIPLDERTTVLETSTGSLAVSQVTSDSVVTDPSFKNYEATRTEPSLRVENGPPLPNDDTQPSFTLDEEALKISEKESSINNRTQVMPPVLSIESAAAPVVKPPRPAVRRTTQSNYQIPRSSSRGFSPMPLVIGLVAILGTYSYLVKSFTPQMSGLIAITDPVFKPLHQMLGVNSAQSTTVAAGPATPLEGNTPRAPSLPEPPPERAPTARRTESITITSSPSGAEIHINGKFTGSFTPASVRVDSGVPVSFTLKKKGYLAISSNSVDPKTINGKINFELKTSDIAYLDILLDDMPPAKLTVNGQEVPVLNGQAKGILVQPNSRITIRAIASENGAILDEAVIRLPVNGKKTIQLRPNKRSRFPSN